MNDKLNIIPVAWLYNLSRKVNYWAFNNGKEYGDSLAWMKKFCNRECPICGEYLYGYDIHDYDIHWTVESYWGCPNKHYFEEYAYGHSAEYVGNKEFHSHHTYSKEKLESINNEIDKEVERMKNKWYHTWFVVSSSVSLIYDTIKYCIERKINRFMWRFRKDKSPF